MFYYEYFQQFRFIICTSKLDYKTKMCGVPVHLRSLCIDRDHIILTRYDLIPTRMQTETKATQTIMNEPLTKHM